MKELKAFQKIDLAPGQWRELTFVLRAADFAFYTADRKWEVEPGEFKIFVGGNSRDVQEAGFTVR